MGREAAYAGGGARPQVLPLPSRPCLPGAAECLEAAAGGPWPPLASLRGDARFMVLALREGLAGAGISSPNPPVGCVLAKAGVVIGAGVHTRAGGAHAEIAALADALGRGLDPAGATAFVTLEPCCHHGRTPPCADALAGAGVARVVAGALDPDPRVAGGGLRRLREAGIEVAGGALEAACAAYHRPFFKRVATGLPWVSFLRLPPPEGMDAVFPVLRNAFRRVSEAVVTDLPTVRIHGFDPGDPWPDPPGHRVLRGIVLDPGGHLGADHPAWRGLHPMRAVREAARPLPGVPDLPCGPGEDGLDLAGLLARLGGLGVGRAVFEGGEALGRSLLRRRLVDEIVAFRPAGHPQGPLGCGLPCGGNLMARFPALGGTWEVHRLQAEDRTS